MSQVHHPEHYKTSKSGIECIEIVEYMPFSLGNAFKYLYRRGDKENEVQDLQKAIKYLEFAKDSHDIIKPEFPPTIRHEVIEKITTVASCEESANICEAMRIIGFLADGPNTLPAGNFYDMAITVIEAEIVELTSGGEPDGFRSPEN